VDESEDDEDIFDLHPNKGKGAASSNGKGKKKDVGSSKGKKTGATSKGKKVATTSTNDDYDEFM
jgi:hypothetical protein